MTARQAVEGLAGKILLNDLALEGDAVCAVGGAGRRDDGRRNPDDAGRAQPRAPMPKRSRGWGVRTADELFSPPPPWGGRENTRNPLGFYTITFYEIGN